MIPMHKFFIGLLLIAFIFFFWFLIAGLAFLVLKIFFGVVFRILRPVLILTLISSGPLLLNLRR